MDLERVLATLVVGRVLDKKVSNMFNIFHSILLEY